MPIIPPIVPSLLSVYDDLINGAESFVDAASKIAPAAVSGVLCTAGGLASLGAGPLGRFQSPGTGNRTLSDFGGILQAACPIPPPLPESPQPPFFGGQCPGVLYNVEYAYYRTGPFGTPRRREVPPQSPRPALGPISAIYPGQERAPGEFGQVRITQQNGDFVWHQFASNSFIDEVEVVSVVRQDGQPDECGDLPPPPPGPRPPIVQPPRSPDIPRIDPDGNPLPPIYFEPRIGPIYIGPQGEISVPVTINIGGPSISVPISIPVSVSLPDFKPSFHFGGRGGGTTPGQPVEPGPPQGICCPRPPRFTQPGDDENPDDPPEPQPEDGFIVGVNVTTAVESAVASATVIGTAQPPLRVPRIATVQFGTGIEGFEFIGADTQVKQLKQFVQAPLDVPITRAFVRWEPGWGGTFEYVYAPRNPGTQTEEEESPSAP